jgi:glucan phosphoethanolaminetransferase (alkaline phosphatase superfamily)
MLDNFFINVLNFIIGKNTDRVFLIVFVGVLVTCILIFLSFKFVRLMHSLVITFFLVLVTYFPSASFYPIIIEKPLLRFGILSDYFVRNIPMESYRFFLVWGALIFSISSTWLFINVLIDLLRKRPSTWRGITNKSFLDDEKIDKSYVREIYLNAGIVIPAHLMDSK